MVATDPVDARLLGMLAEMGRAAVHELAARVGMDPREVASRLVALSGSGLPLLVGVECDPNGIRNALMAAQPMNQGGWSPQQQQGYPQPQQFPNAMQPMQQGVPSGGFPGPYQQQPQQGYGPPQGSGPYQMGPPSGPQQALPAPNNFQRSGPPSQPFPVAPGPASQPFPPPNTGGGEAFSTWGPPQTSSWARGDQPPNTGGPDLTQPTVRSTARIGPVGSTLETDGLEGEQLAIKVVEVVDPADYLFTAAGYRLQEGERSVVVHTEVRNRGTTTFSSLPDLYLVLVTADGRSISKAPVSLSSRPPHRIGVAPGETAGGHTVYVLPEETNIASVRWSPRPDDEKRALNWNITN
ncbi:AsnC family protein [Labedaea rhizosphaerae]|uniref:AsnC family protein n=1 Tax=Labedaea rhizosphaerae TaxID=598644 RepID=UPI00105FAD92|nr:AsnC family protein [Labedaea rhizosphaerae]